VSALGELFGDRPEQRTSNAPQNRYEFRRAATDLARRGLTPTDIAGLLNLSAQGVRELLDEQSRIERQRLLR
jgi:hypothetical protein